MDEFIEREALITKFKKMELGEHGLVERLFADGVYAVIAAFSAADVAPVVHGWWKKVRKSRSTWECSVCGTKVGAFFAGCSQYCYCCGAQMGGVTE